MCSNNSVTVFPEKEVNMPKDDDATLQGCFNPSSATFRYTGIILMCLAAFSSNFCYDNPGALEDYFENNLDMSTENFVMLYSIYSWPNIFCCFIGGFLVDRVFGIRWGTVIYMALTLTGHVIFAAAAYINVFWLMLFGRFIFGVGVESLTVAVCSYFALWFNGKELNAAFGMHLCFCSLASAVNFLTMENIHSYVLNTLHYRKGPQSIGIALLFAALTCVASMISVIFLSAMDKKAEKQLRRDENRKVEVMKIQDVKDFSKIFWLATIICVMYTITVYPFLSLAKVYFITKYELTAAAANTATSMVYIISAITGPIFGILIDKTGKNIMWNVVSIIGKLVAHSLLAFSYVSPYVSMVIFGLSFSLFEISFRPFITLIVSEHQVGTAYGIVGAVVNLGLAVAVIICGKIVDKLGYFMLEGFFLFCLSSSLVTAVILWILVKKTAAVNSTKG